MNDKQSNSPAVFLPIFLSFFVMGFVDIAGVATNYVKKDFDLSDSVANLIPVMVFVWFAVFSVPTGLLMGKTGRKKTVMLSLVITAATIEISALMIMGVSGGALLSPLQGLITDMSTFTTGMVVLLAALLIMGSISFKFKS
jgi:fucose permease